MIWKWLAIGFIGVAVTIAAYNVTELVSESEKYKACIARFTPDECKGLQ